MRSPLIQNVIGAQPPIIDRAEGVWLFDTEGRRYFDACSGAVVTGIGHAHPGVVAAIAHQAKAVTFTHRGAFSSAPLEKLAERVTALTGYAGAWFVGSGSEAVEAAMQLAQQYFREIGQPQRTRFLSHAQGYHGNTLGGLSLSGHARRVVVGDLAHDFARLEAPYPFRKQVDADDAGYTARLLAAAEQHITEEGDRLAGIVIEPIGGATLGATVPPAGYLAGLRELCDRYDILLIADEVMTGLGRTGAILAMQHWGVRADIVALGKGLGAGYTPIAAALVSDRVLSALENGSARIPGGHTYAGNPLSAATALAVLDVVENDGVIDRAAAAGIRLGALLHTLSAHPSVVDARGIGMLWALEFDSDSAVGHRASTFAAIAQRRGAIVYVATGGFNDAVLIAPPLVTTDEELDELGRILDASLTEFDEAIAAARPTFAVGVA